jgi:hypothetical protein
VPQRLRGRRIAKRYNEIPSLDTHCHVTARAGVSKEETISRFGEETNGTFAR